MLISKIRPHDQHYSEYFSRPALFFPCGMIFSLDQSYTTPYRHPVLIFKSKKTLHWGELDVPLWGLEKDWHERLLDSASAFSLVIDDRNLWFIAASRLPAKVHPAARPGAFVAELWKHDVAELFIADPCSGRYIEFNLAANGAWWSCEFRAPRERAESIDIAFPGVATHAELSIDGGWMAALAIPIDLLGARIGFGATSLINVTFIVASPDQKFVSAAKLPGVEPDFHQPGHFSGFQFHELEET
jgi:hypothetical protein